MMDDMFCHERMRREILDWIDSAGKGVIKMFDQQKVMQEVFNLSKNYWLNTMEMVTTFQNQNEKMWNALIEQGLVSQQEAKKMVQEGLSRWKQARKQFQETMEDNWKKAESAFGAASKTGK